MFELFPLVDVHTDTRSSYGVQAFHTHLLDLSFIAPTRAPGASGSLHVSLAGSPFSSAESFSVAESLASSVSAVLRTPTVYRDDGISNRNQVIVAAQVRDAVGNTVSSSASVRLKVGFETGSPLSITSTSGFSTPTYTVPEEWFNPEGDQYVDVELELLDGSEVVITTVALGSVTIARPHSHPALSSPGMWLALPESPRFAEDTIGLSLRASLIGKTYGLFAWSVALSFDPLALEWGTYAKDSIWGDASDTVADTLQLAQGSVEVLVNSPADTNPANTFVRGEDIPILTATLDVLGSVAPGTYDVSLNVKSMVNFGNNMIVENEAASVYDGRDGLYASGELGVHATSPRGLFAYGPSGRATLSNFAPITGDVITVGTISAYSVTDRPHGASFVQATSYCFTSSTSLAMAPGGLSCDVELSPNAEAGGPATVTVFSGSQSVDVPFDVSTWVEPTPPSPPSPQPANCIRASSFGRCTTRVRSHWRPMRTSCA